MLADESKVVIVKTVVTPRLTRAGVADRSSQKLKYSLYYRMPIISVYICKELIKC